MDIIVYFPNFTLMTCLKNIWYHSLHSFTWMTPLYIVRTSLDSLWYTFAKDTDNLTMLLKRYHPCVSQNNSHTIPKTGIKANSRLAWNANGTKQTDETEGLNKPLQCVNSFFQGVRYSYQLKPMPLPWKWEQTAERKSKKVKGRGVTGSRAAPSSRITKTPWLS